MKLIKDASFFTKKHKFYESPAYAWPQVKFTSHLTDPCASFLLPCGPSFIRLTEAKHEKGFWPTVNLYAEIPSNASVLVCGRVVCDGQCQYPCQPPKALMGAHCTAAGAGWQMEIILVKAAWLKLEIVQ